MFLIIGLGNPGKEYQNTWHSLGRLSVNHWRTSMGFPDFYKKARFNSLVSEGVFDDKEIILALPETFMNNSGKAVKLLIGNWKLKIENCVVVHDDADLPQGKLRISKDRGTAGHKGIDSIVKALKSKSFVRIRIGIRPTNYVPGSKSLDRFVLKKFTKNEERIVAGVIKKTSEAIGMILKDELPQAMSQFN
ncbi:MAG: aminoacyl-tRNA hydrolase [bacterium]|nr:aminoacyl-tRNA hydrolase [bacterium]